MEVDTWSYPVRDGDVLLLCSDGLTSMINQQQIAEILATSPDLAQAGGRLIRAANEAGGRDNITVILFRLEEVGGPDDAGDSTVVGVPARDLAAHRRRHRAPRGGDASRAPRPPQTGEPPAVDRARGDRGTRWPGRRGRRRRRLRPSASGATSSRWPR